MDASRLTQLSDLESGMPRTSMAFSLPSPGRPKTSIVRLLDIPARILDVGSTKPPTSRLEDLPNEILFHMLYLLPARARINISLTNKAFARRAVDTILRIDIRDLSTTNAFLCSDDSHLPVMMTPMQPSMVQLKCKDAILDFFRLKCLKCQNFLADNIRYFRRLAEVINDENWLLERVEHFKMQAFEASYDTWGLRAVLTQGLKLKIHQQSRKISEMAKIMGDETWESLGWTEKIFHEQTVSVGVTKAPCYLLKGFSEGPRHWPNTISKAGDIFYHDIELNEAVSDEDLAAAESLLRLSRSG
jgi:hypothetical protein